MHTSQSLSRQGTLFSSQVVFISSTSLSSKLRSENRCKTLTNRNSFHQAPHNNYSEAAAEETRQREKTRLPWRPSNILAPPVNLPFFLPPLLPTLITFSLPSIPNLLLLAYLLNTPLCFNLLSSFTPSYLPSPLKNVRLQERYVHHRVVIPSSCRTRGSFPPFQMGLRAILAFATILEPRR